MTIRTSCGPEHTSLFYLSRGANQCHLPTGRAAKWEQVMFYLLLVTAHTTNLFKNLSHLPRRRVGILTSRVNPHFIVVWAYGKHCTRRTGYLCLKVSHFNCPLAIMDYTHLIGQHSTHGKKLRQQAALTKPSYEQCYPSTNKLNKIGKG